MHFFEIYQLLCHEIGKTPTGVGKELNVDGSTVNYWKNGHTPKKQTLLKIAKYFNVSVDFLIGNTTTRNTIDNQSPDDIAKVALFGGDTDVTDEMWDEVKQFVDFVKSKHRKDSKSE